MINVIKVFRELRMNFTVRKHGEIIMKFLRLRKILLAKARNIHRANITRKFRHTRCLNVTREYEIPLKRALFKSFGIPSDLLQYAHIKRLTRIERLPLIFKAM